MPAAPTDLAGLRQAVDDLVGVEFSDDDERDRAINEGNVELCTRSGWTRDTLEFGPAVADQTFYDLPATWRKPATHVLTVGALDYGPADPLAIREFERGATDLETYGAWWLDYQGGLPVLGVIPIPAAGTTIQMLSVVTPPILTDPTDEPPVPWDSRFAIVHYAASLGLVGPEDDLEAYQFHRAAFELAIQRLEQLRIERESGDGPMQVAISGIHY